MTIDAARANRAGWRLIVGYGAILATLPYVVLKVLWLSGNLWGVPASSPAAGREFVSANAITLAMDAVAVVLALVLTHRWGRSVPVWLLVVPVWVGTGLLIPASLQVAVNGLLSVVAGGDALTLEGGLVEPWVYVTVGVSFAAQGVLLTAAFTGYARSRWKTVFDPAVEPRAGDTHGVQLVVARGAAVLVAAIVVAYGYWLFAATGPFGDYEDGWELSQRSNVAVAGLLAAGAVVGVFGMLRPSRRLSFGRAVILAWAGTGSLFGWGLYRTVVVLSQATLARDLTPLSNLVQFASVVAGLLLALVAVMRIAERGLSRG